jgi:hypothetical protein
MYDNTFRWMRFRDDCFMQFSLDTSDVAAFLESCNSAHETLKFKLEASSVSVPFLDTEVTVSQDGILYVQPYLKPVYAFQYLHRSSAHPRSVFGSFVKGELLRLVRNSTYEADYLRHAGIFRTKLMRRGYEPEILDAIFQSVVHVVARQSQFDQSGTDNAGTKFVLCISVLSSFGTEYVEICAIM